MTFDSLEKVVLVCIFIMPGFICNAIIKLFCPREKRSDTVTILYCLEYSLINIALFSGVYFALLPLQEKSIILFLSLCVLCSIVFATIIGIIIGVFKSKAILQRIANKLHLNVSNHIPTAWDYYFSKQIPCFIIVILNDDSRVYGWYGTESFTSSSEQERDIYIEQLYTVDDDNIWHAVNNSNGILINMSAIKSLEFIRGVKK